MPRNRRHGNVAVQDRPTDTNDNATQEIVMTTATANDEATEVDEDTDDVTFEIVSEPAPEDYSPDRKTPGRQRKPSYFDGILRDPNVYEQGWQRVAVTSDEHKAFVLRELNRAKMHLNKLAEDSGEDEIGLDLDDKKDDAVYYKSRKAQKRERKASANALAAEAEAEGLVDPDGDNDE